MWGAWAGQGRGPGWTRFPRVAKCYQGLYFETLGNSGRERAVSGLLLGRAAPGEGSTVSWLQPAAFHPIPVGTTHRASTCARAPSQGGGAHRWSSPALTLTGAGRRYAACSWSICCHQVPFLCYQHLGSCPAPIPLCGCELGPRCLPCSGLLCGALACACASWSPGVSRGM